MAAPTNHWKLGFFVVVGFVVAMATVVALGARSLKKTTVSYRSYYDESVQGLDVGSPVKFRGVAIGSVSAIEVAPDHRHVSVGLELDVDGLPAIGLSATATPDPRMVMPVDLRTQLGSSGITGVKFILLDFFPVAENPVQSLPFPVPENTIPSAVSMMKNLEDSVVRAVDRFPEIAGNVDHLIGQMSALVGGLESEHIGQRASATLSNVDETVAELRVAVRGMNTPDLARRAQATMTNLDGALSRTSGLIDRLQADKGLVSNAERAANAVGDLAHGASGLGSQLEETMKDIQDAAEAVHRLGDELERDPDMLLKGRSRYAR
jgi:phospholipid/cholesterol/gamma-HCH transport system substrate-binding protein